MKIFYSGNEAVGAAFKARLTDAGFECVAAARDAEAVVTFFAAQQELEEAYFGENGLLQTAGAGATLIDLSACTPVFARELAAVATVNDFMFVEAPLVVGDILAADAFAEPETLSCFVAGEEDAVQRAMPLLQAAVGTVVETGGAGTAQVARAACTLQVVAQTLAVIEAHALRYAVDSSASGAGMGTFAFPALSPQADALVHAIEAEQFSGTYTAEMLMAELSAALMAADDADIILPQAEAAMHLLELLAVIGGADKAPAALALAYGEEADCARHGLDWTRAEQQYGEHDHEHCGHDHDDDYDYDDYDYDDMSDWDYHAN